MSYSFRVRGSTKDEVSRAVKAELVKVVEAQPVHEADKMQALSNAVSCIELLGIDNSKVTEDKVRDILIDVSGSIATGQDGKICAAAINANAWLVNKE